MERRINKKIENYISDFKDNVKEKASELGLSKDPNLSQLVQYIYDYDRLALCKDDFMKRKRVKNIVHLSDNIASKIHLVIEDSELINPKWRKDGSGTKN